MEIFFGIQFRVTHCQSQENMLEYDFDRQKPIDNYIVDFYCKALKLAIEVDGKYHNHDDIPEKDENRQKRLESLGVRFLRYSEIEIQQNLKFVTLTYVR